MYRRLMKTGIYVALAFGFWMATPDAQAQRRGGWGGGRGVWGSGWGNSPGFGVDRGGFYAGPSYGRYGNWGNYGYGYGSGWNDRAWNSSWYGSTYPRSSYYYSPGYGYSYPSSTYYYSAPAVTYSYPSTTYQSAPATTYSAPAPSYGSSAIVGASSASSASRSRDTAHLRVHVPDPTAQVWVNDAPTQQRGMERVFETPPLSSDRTNTYEIRAKWLEDGRTMEQTRTVRLQPGAQEVINFGQAE